MQRPAVYVLALVVAGQSSARADGVVEELSAGTSPAPEGAQAPSWLTDKLAGIWEPGDDWQLRLDVSGTRTFHAQASDLAVASASVEYDPDAHWSLRLAVGGSPSSTSESTMLVRAETAMGNAAAGDAAVLATSSSLTGSAWLGYDTAGDGAAETSIIASASAISLDSQQQITSVTGRRGQELSLDELRAFCAGHPCAAGVTGALAGASTRLGQLVLGAGVSETLYQDTDLGLDGAYNLYDKDPTQVGAFSPTRAGQTLGGGTGIAPVLYSVTPSVAHRFGRIMAMSSVAYSRYVDGQGYALDATVRVQLKLAYDGDQRLKLYAKLTGSRDVDAQAAVSKAGSLGLGVQYAW